MKQLSMTRKEPERGKATAERSSKTGSSLETHPVLFSKNRKKLSSADIEILESTWGKDAKHLATLCKIPDILMPATSLLPLKLGSAGGKNATTWGMDKNRLTEAVRDLEQASGKRMGDLKKPLLFSIRLMFPGQDRGGLVLSNVGLVRKQLTQICSKRPNETRFWLECYCRFLIQIGEIYEVFQPDAEQDPIEEAIKRHLPHGFTGSSDPSQDRELWLLLERIESVLKSFGFPIQTVPLLQLQQAIDALLRFNDFQETSHTQDSDSREPRAALILQEMVFGNRTSQSAYGALITREPATGLRPQTGLAGRVIFCSQEEELMSGWWTGESLEAIKTHRQRSVSSNYQRLKKLSDILEREMKDIVLAQFVLDEVSPNKVNFYVAKIASPARSPIAESCLATQLVERRLSTPAQALSLVTPSRFRSQYLPKITREARSRCMLIARGIPACPGVVTGEVVFDPSDAEAEYRQGKEVVILTPSANSDIEEGIDYCVGLVTTTGWEASPGTLAALQRGIPAVIGASEIEFGRDAAGGYVNLGGCTLRKGDLVTVDGERGEVFAGRAEKKDSPHPADAVQKVLQWALDAKKMEIRAYADDPEIVLTGLSDGMGLMSTEHLFKSASLDAAKDIVFGRDGIRRKRAQSVIYESSEAEFLRVLDRMNKKSVMIRLLDAPLCDFLPTGSELEKEENPLMGQRGIRLALNNEDVLQIQLKAILTASAKLAKRSRVPNPEIAIPMATFPSEIRLVKEALCKTAGEVKAEVSSWPIYSLGFLVETPASALQAREMVLALQEEVPGAPRLALPKTTFVSLGLKRLCQFALGMAEKEADAFLRPYVEQGVLQAHPFEHVPAVLTQLIRTCVADIRSVAPKMPIYLVAEGSFCPEVVQMATDLSLSGICIHPDMVSCAVIQAGQCAFNA